MKVGDKVKINPDWHLDFPCQNGEPNPVGFVGEIVEIHPTKSTSGDKIVTMVLDFDGKRCYYTGIDRMFIEENEE